MKYAFKEGAFGKRPVKEAQEIGELFEEFSSANQQFGPKVVLEHAKNRNSVLHKYFEWDDTVAGEKWRLAQASQLICDVVLVHDDSEVPRVRAFIPVGENDRRGRYVPLGRVLSTPSYRERMIQDALDDMEAYQEKYRLLRNINDWWKSTQAAKKALKNRASRGSATRGQARPGSQGRVSQAKVSRGRQGQSRSGSATSGRARRGRQVA